MKNSKDQSFNAGLRGPEPPPAGPIVPIHLDRPVSVEQTLETIFDSGHPARLVRALAVEDLHWLLLNAEPETSLRLLRLASEEQWQYFLDLMTWDAEGLHTDSLAVWFARLLLADAPRFCRWAMHRSPTLLLLFLARTIEVWFRDYDEPPEVNLEEWFTLDDVAYIRCRDTKYAPLVRDAVKRLADSDYEALHNLLLALGGFLPAEEEETARRFRDARLAEKGFVPYDEAMYLYAHVKPSEFVGGRLSGNLEGDTDTPPAHLPVTPVRLAGEDTAFFQALSRVDDTLLLDRLMMEFAGVCNHLMSADSIVPEEPETLQRLYQKASGMISIGMERLAGNDASGWSETIRVHNLFDLFRLGFSAVLDVRRQLAGWRKKSWFRAVGLSWGFWDEPWGETLRCLGLRRPVRYDPSHAEDSYRSFSTVAQVEDCRNALGKVRAVDRFLEDLSEIDLPEDLCKDRWFTFRNCLYTIWARASLEVKPVFAPLSHKQLEAFLDRMGEVGPHRDLWSGDEVIEAFFERLECSLASEDPDLPILKQVYQDLLDHAWSLFSPVGRKDMDPRFVDLFWVDSN